MQGVKKAIAGATTAPRFPPRSERPTPVTLPFMPSAASPADTMFQRLLCCVCGQDTADSDDYVLLGISAPGIATEQWLGAHARHLNSVLAQGFSVEVHEM